MNKTMKRNIVVSAILTIMLCVSLITGATFALFTSESKVNIAVTSGKVSVVANIDESSVKTKKLNETEYTDGADYMYGGKASFTSDGLKLSTFVPGDAIKFDIVVTNNSNVTVQYRTIVSCENDGGLFEGLEVSVGDYATYNGATVKTDWKQLAVGAEIAKVPVEIELPESAGDEYQEKTCTITYTVKAVQGNAEMPSEWDGTTTTAPATDESGVYHITNANEFAWLMNKTSGSINSPYAGKTFILDCDIDFENQTISGIGSDKANIIFTFDGNGHTIKNFRIDPKREWYAGLFNQFGGHVKNLTVDNAVVIGQSMAGAIASNVEGGGSIENCHVTNSVVSASTKKAGAVVGYMWNASVKNCTATDCSVYCGDTGVEESGEIIGFINSAENANNITENNTATRVTVERGVSIITDGVVLRKGEGETTDVYLISNANGLLWFADQVNNQRNSFYGKEIRLTNDINLKGIEWVSVGGSNVGYAFCGTFDGNEKTISNLSVSKCAPSEEGKGGGYGFFGWIHQGSVVKDVTFDKANVKGDHYCGVVVGYIQWGTVENCTVKNSTVSCLHTDLENGDSNVRCGDKAGAVIGFAGCNVVTVKNCHAEKCTVIAARDAAQVIGYGYSTNQNCTFENNTATEVSVIADSTNCSHKRAGQVSSDKVMGGD